MSAKPIPKGATFTISTGEYSDYSVHGVFVAREQIDTKALKAEWLVDHPQQNEDYSFNDHQFIAWLAAKGLMEAIDSWEWHISEYGCLNEGWLMDPEKEERS